MKTIGIIAEYNPFHNGHAYQINEIKKRTGADYVVIAMSGDFVQRGTPAIIDKYARTKMALSCGADLVIELPAIWATASAESFAMAGVTLFDKMGCIDGLCFGAETNKLPLLSMLAETLANEPAEYQALLSSYLKEGLTFPAARAKALCGHFHSDAVSSILNEPNNILAIEYLKALKRRSSSIEPLLLKREGAGYHDTEMLTDTTVPIASATAIRETLLNTVARTNPLSNSETDTGFILQADASSPKSILQITDKLTTCMPATAKETLNNYLESRPFMQTNDFSSILGYQLLNVAKEELAAIGDCNPDIANRLSKNRSQFSSFDKFCELNKSKDTTYTRINRILLHLILKIATQDYLRAKNLDYIPYLRILGFQKASSILLKELKSTACVPVISKLADASSLLSEDAMWLLEKDIFAADLYEQICSIKKKTIPRSEYTREIVLI